MAWSWISIDVVNTRVPRRPLIHFFFPFFSPVSLFSFFLFFFFCSTPFALVFFISLFSSFFLGSESLFCVIFESARRFLRIFSYTSSVARRLVVTGDNGGTRKFSKETHTRRELRTNIFVESLSSIICYGLVHTCNLLVKMWSESIVFSTLVIITIDMDFKFILKIQISLWILIFISV